MSFYHTRSTYRRSYYNVNPGCYNVNPKTFPFVLNYGNSRYKNDTQITENKLGLFKLGFLITIKALMFAGVSIICGKEI